MFSIPAVLHRSQSRHMYRVVDYLLCGAQLLNRNYISHFSCIADFSDERNSSTVQDNQRLCTVHIQLCSLLSASPAFCNVPCYFGPSCVPRYVLRSETFSYKNVHKERYYSGNYFQRKSFRTSDESTALAYKLEERRAHSSSILSY